MVRLAGILIFATAVVQASDYKFSTMNVAATWCHNNDSGSYTPWTLHKSRFAVVTQNS